MVELPNVNLRLSEVYIEADVTVTFSSNSGTDTYATVQPAIVKWGTSLINQVRLLAGSTEVSNIRQCNTIYNWQQNITSNSITRNKEQYNNVTPAAYTAATAKRSDFRSVPSQMTYGLVKWSLAWSIYLKDNFRNILGSPCLLYLCSRCDSW